jgi:hypothetical protein
VTAAHKPPNGVPVNQNRAAIAELKQMLLNGAHFETPGTDFSSIASCNVSVAGFCNTARRQWRCARMTLAEGEPATSARSTRIV